MLDGQDTEDDKLAWRVEAELKLKLDELRRTDGAAAAALATQLESAQVRTLTWGHMPLPLGLRRRCTLKSH